MQGATLIIRIIGAMFVLAAILMTVMMVHMIDLAAVGQVGSNIPFVLEGVLEMHADQWRDTRGLSE
jgi:hypothetical protein